MSDERVNWKDIVQKVKEGLVAFQHEGIKPTLRTVFYRLVSQEVIPNTSNSYKRLSKVLVAARKTGDIPFDALEDRGRYSITRFGDSCLDTANLDSIEIECYHRGEEINIDNVIDAFFDYDVFRLQRPEDGYWAKQPTIPEIWTEKDAIAAIIEKWTENLHVNIRVNRGYDSWTFLHTCSKELEEVLKRHDKVVILYIGDLDPSGIDMDRHCKGALEFFQLSDRVEFKRLALLPEHVEAYNLPPKPTDKATLKKLNNDSRMNNYAEEYITEIDAFLALANEQFKLLLRDVIMQYHDKSLSSEVDEENANIESAAAGILENAKLRAKEIFIAQIRGEVQ